ncbi:MAG: hypothetical protein M1837_003270 [Sclerophora amabilis]|nr:MAG: hypothetical protein M1837_003270 [Sclerophora amabilis]
MSRQSKVNTSWKDTSPNGRQKRSLQRLDVRTRQPDFGKAKQPIDNQFQTGRSRISKRSRSGTQNLEVTDESIARRKELLEITEKELELEERRLQLEEKRKALEKR